MQGKTILIIGGVAVAALAIYLYLRRRSRIGADPQDAQRAGMEQILASYRGIAGDDPSTVKGDLQQRGFYVTSTENRPAAEFFVSGQLTGHGGAIRTAGGIVDRQVA